MFVLNKGRLLAQALEAYAGKRAAKRLLLQGREALDLRIYGYEGTVLRIDSVLLTSGALSALEDFDAYRRDYFDWVISPILDSAGEISGLEGDMVQAWWTTEQSANHAVAACEVAVKILSRVSAANERPRSDRYPKTGVRIGIQTGQVGIGNYGVPNRMTYGILGHPVNAAYALCTRDRLDLSGMPILIGEETQKLVSDRFSCVYLTSANVVGVPRPVKMYVLKT